MSHHSPKQRWVCTFTGGEHWGCSPESCNRATVINPRTKDKAEGKFHEVKDKVKGEIRTTDQ